MEAMTAFHRNPAQLKDTMADITALIGRIDASIPLLQLAISASGESLSTNLPDSVSPSRMLQASAFLMIADTQFAANPHSNVQIGPDFIVSVYMIFKGYSYTATTGSANNNLSLPDTQNVRKPVWQEVLHKARLRLYRLPILDPTKTRHMHHQDYSYSLEISEDRNDGRLHADTQDSAMIKACDLIPAAEISKLFYTNSASILNIRDDLAACNSPILLIKRVSSPDITCATDNSSCINLSECEAEPESDSDIQYSIDCQVASECDRHLPPESAAIDVASPKTYSRFPSYLDPGWIALEMYIPDVPESSESDESDAASAQSDTDDEISVVTANSRLDTNTQTVDIAAKFNLLSIEKVNTSQDDTALKSGEPSIATIPYKNDVTPSNPVQAVTTSLSLLELLIRLVVAQEAQGCSHLAIPDHILTFFLNGALRSNTAQDGK